MKKWHEQRHAPAPGTPLCDTADIPDGEVREFRFGGDSPFAFRMFITNDGGTLRAFRNACPHFDVPLNHMPGELFTPDRQRFLCMTHFAQFDRHTGQCVAGPCEGQSLEAIPLQQAGSRLQIGDIPGQS